MSRFMGASKGIGVGFGGAGPLISLGGAFWTGYFDADQSMTLSGSDVATWTSLVGSHVMTPGAVAPSLGTLGLLRAVVFDKANTESLTNTSLVSVFAGDDTPFTVAMHVVLTTYTTSDTLYGVSQSASGVYYLWQRGAGTPADTVLAGRAGGAAVTGTPRMAVSAATEYVLVFVRHGDTYDLCRNGSRIVTGGALALASLGALNKFTLGCLYISGVELYFGDFKLRRFAIASGSGITDAQLVTLDAEWRGK